MTNNKQQTAVEWLEKQTRKPEWHSLKRGDIFEQAKAMEKQMTIKLYADYENYLEETFKNQNGGQAVILSFGAFYDQTYGEDDSLKINNGGHQI
jgi:hypothetical protein